MRKISILVIALFSCHMSIACSCMPTGNYMCQSFENDSLVSLVCICRKIETVAYGFRVERLHTLYGDEQRDTFMVWGDNGALCRLFDTWNVGDTMLLALQPCDTAGNFFENPDFPPDLEQLSDYQVSTCGSYAADIENGKVIGWITDSANQEISIDSIIQSNCFSRLTNSVEKLEKETIALFPVPSAEIVYISSEVSNLPEGSVHDISGKKILSVQVQYGMNQIPVNALPDGIYFLRIPASQGVIFRKFIVRK